MQCSQPVHSVDEFGRDVFFRCNKCYECLQSRASAWVSRLLIEKEVWTNSYFFTLTYNDESLVWNFNHTKAIVSKEHISKFVADLRSRFQQGFFHYQGIRFELPIRSIFKYYITAEYGSNEFTERPHYHGMLFINCEDLDLLFLLFTDTWNKGIVDFQEAGDRAAGYISKYLVKYDLEEFSPYIIDEDGEKVFAPVERCFSHMSKGLGKSYITPSRLHWHRVDPVHRGYLPMPGGVKLPMSRYFTEKIFDSEMRAQRADEQQKLKNHPSGSQEEEKEHRERVRLAKYHYLKRKSKI